MTRWASVKSEMMMMMVMVKMVWMMMAMMEARDKLCLRGLCL